MSNVEYIECGKIKKEYRVSHLDFEMLIEEISVPLYSLYQRMQNSLRQLLFALHQMRPTLPFKYPFLTLSHLSQAIIKLVYM